MLLGVIFSFTWFASHVLSNHTAANLSGFFVVSGVLMLLTWVTPCHSKCFIGAKKGSSALSQMSHWCSLIWFQCLYVIPGVLLTFYVVAVSSNVSYGCLLRFFCHSRSSTTSYFSEFFSFQMSQCHSLRWLCVPLGFCYASFQILYCH